jgi:hypothetical protein
MNLIHPEFRARRGEQLAAVILMAALLIVLVASMFHGVHNLS